ncbi:hypothetical protein A2U01_0023684, partial [Trifolium medium]|nr:hypothetical protein [Trifolium medium]
YPFPSCQNLTTNIKIQLISPKEPSSSDTLDQWRRPRENFLCKPSRTHLYIFFSRIAHFSSDPTISMAGSITTHNNTIATDNPNSSNLHNVEITLEPHIEPILALVADENP